MRRNQNSNNKSKNADKGKDKDQTLDTSDLLIESRLIATDNPTEACSLHLLAWKQP